MGVRRHLAALAADGLVEQSTVRPGRPRAPAGRLAADRVRPGDVPPPVRRPGPRLIDELLPEELAGVLARRNDKQVAQYQAAVGRVRGPPEQVAEVARLRDLAGYQAEWAAGRRTASSSSPRTTAPSTGWPRATPPSAPSELSLLQQVLGPDVEVTRLAHAMAGDAVCSYCIRPRQGDPEP